MAISSLREAFFLYLSFYPTFLFLRSGRASSITVILTGSILYTWFKHKESSPSSPPQRAASEEIKDLELGEKKRVQINGAAHDSKG